MKRRRAENGAPWLPKSMSVKSVYLPSLDSLEEAGVIRIVGDEHRHLVVARAEPGESIEAFDGRGAVWTAKVESVGKKEVLARVEGKRTVAREPHELILGLALVRAAAFELALEKAVEIGVTRIAPFIAARSNASAPRRTDRWTRIVVEAAKQSKRFHLPVVDEPVEFEAMLSLPVSTRIVFAERGGGSLKSALAGSPLLYLVGPEGGWTDAELEQACEKGFSVVTLGPGILKAETAAIVGGALIRYELQG